MLPTDKIAVGALEEHGMGLLSQPSNSPDLNVLDLGFFNSIQELQQRLHSKNLEELVIHVQEAFKMEKWETMEKVWLTLQGCMQQIMEKEGGNDYKIHHQGKGVDGFVSKDLICDMELVQKCHMMLRSFKNPLIP